MFETKAKERRHCRKHRLEVGALSCADYVFRALNFMTKGLTAGMVECTRLGGETVRFDPNTQEFGVSSPNGYLITYFLPEPVRHGLASNMMYYLQECGKP